MEFATTNALVATRAMNARTLLEDLIGQELTTITYGKWNRVLRIERNKVIVATESSPSGVGVSISRLQAALDLLDKGDWVRIDKQTVGSRTAFIGAVLSTLDGVEVEESPRRVRRLS